MKNTILLILSIFIFNSLPAQSDPFMFGSSKEAIKERHIFLEKYFKEGLTTDSIPYLSIIDSAGDIIYYFKDEKCYAVYTLFRTKKLQKITKKQRTALLKAESEGKIRRQSDGSYLLDRFRYLYKDEEKGFVSSYKEKVE